MITYYSILGCDENSPYDQIKQNYFSLLRIWHPDKQEPSTTELSANFDKFVQIITAWNTLRDTLRRKKYNNWLAEQQLRQSKELIEREIYVHPFEFTFEEFCRCGGFYIVEIEEFERIIDYALIECSNCSLCLKLYKVNEQRE